MPRLVFILLLGGVVCLVAQTNPSVVAVGPAAQEPSNPISLAQALEMAHRANPSLLAQEQHLLAVRAQEITAGLRQNPNAIVGSQMTTLRPGDPNGTDFYQIGISRLFERGSKRKTRLENAQSTTLLATFQAADQQRQIDLDVRQEFSRMLFSQQAAEILRSNLEGYRSTVELMRVRLDTGAIDKTDFDRVELQLAGFESDLENAQLSLHQSSFALQTLLGIKTPKTNFSIDGTLNQPDLRFSLEELQRRALAKPT